MSFTSGCSIAVGFHPQLKTCSVCCVETRMKALVYQIMLKKKKKLRPYRARPHAPTSGLCKCAALASVIKSTCESFARAKEGVDGEKTQDGKKGRSASWRDGQGIGVGEIRCTSVSLQRRGRGGKDFGEEKRKVRREGGGYRQERGKQACKRAESLKCSMGERGGAGGLRLRQRVSRDSSCSAQTRAVILGARGWHKITNAPIWLSAKYNLRLNSRILTAYGWWYSSTLPHGENWAAFYGFLQRSKALK